MAVGNNDVYVCRHGESEANLCGLIISGREGVEGYGLTEKGREQARGAAEQLRRELEATGRKPVIVSSDFTRAEQTAGILAECLDTRVQIDERLRERFFGDFDKTASDNYLHVWEEDAKDAEHTKFSVESVRAVADRTQALVSELTAAHDGAAVILVAHGDTLQICQTWAQGRPLTEHRQVEYLGNADVRKILPLG